MARRKNKRRKRREPVVDPKIAAQFGMQAPQKVEPGERFISPNQAGRILNITGEAVKQWIYHRRLPAVKLSNGYWKIRVRDLEQYIDNRNDAVKKVLLLADEHHEKMLCKVLDSLDCTKVVAANTTDALLKAADVSPDLLIVCLNVPNAWEFLHKIKKSRHVHTRPVLLVADKQLSDKEQETALTMGIQGVVPSDKLSVHEVERLITAIR